MHFIASLLAFRLQFLNKLEFSGDLTAPCLPLCLWNATSRLLFRRRGIIPLFVLHHPPPSFWLYRDHLLFTLDKLLNVFLFTNYLAHSTF